MKRGIVHKMLALLCCTAMWCQYAVAENWITGLGDDVYVHQLNIPGAHDAATGEGFERFYMGWFARTQDVGLRAQWDSGIRAFDLRPAAVQKRNGECYLKIFHGRAETKMRFDDALRLLCQQLKKNPGEFAIVIVRHEREGEKRGLGNLWEVLMDSLLNADEFRGRLIPFRHNLTVGEMRGKVLVLSRDAYLGNVRLVGGYIMGWTHSPHITAQRRATIYNKVSGESSPLYVQDFYNCTKGHITTKLATMKTMFEEASHALQVPVPLRPWIIHHTSGYTRSASSNGYRKNAESTHKYALQWLASSPPSLSLGIVMMDFTAVNKSRGYDVMSLALTRALIESNR